MKIFLDTGNIGEIREAAALGILDGVTTNPSLIAKEGKPFKPAILQIYKNYGFKTQVLAASLRHPLHVVEAALAGAHVGTLPYKVLDSMFNHPLTDKGLAQFLKDWEKAKE